MATSYTRPQLVFIIDLIVELDFEMRHKFSRIYKKRSSGFTLIELMITVAIVGILAAIGYPAYTDYVIRAKRADGKAALLQLQLAQEKWRANHTSYGSKANLGITASPDGYYTVNDFTNLGATTYTVTVSPNGFTDTKCGTLGINQDGVKTETGSESVADCWGR